MLMVLPLLTFVSAGQPTTPVFVASGQPDNGGGVVVAVVGAVVATVDVGVADVAAAVVVVGVTVGVAVTVLVTVFVTVVLTGAGSGHVSTFDVIEHATGVVGAAAIAAVPTSSSAPVTNAMTLPRGRIRQRPG
jgi:hypothetical protein